MELKNDALLLTPSLYTTILGNNNNIIIQSSLVVITTSNIGDKITGIEYFGDGHLIELVNISTNPLIITHNDSNSLLGNRILTDTGQPLTIRQYDFIRGLYVNGFFLVSRIGTKGKLTGHASIKNTVDFTFGVINTATPITFNLNDSISGSINHSTSINTSRIIASEKGILELVGNAQLFKIAGGVSNIFFWFRKNGVDISNSGYNYDMGINDNKMLIVNGNFEVDAGDYIEIVASVSDINIRLESQPASAPVPAIPSIIVECKLFTPIV